MPRGPCGWRVRGRREGPGVDSESLGYAAAMAGPLPCWRNAPRSRWPSRGCMPSPARRTSPSTGWTRPREWRQLDGLPEGRPEFRHPPRRPAFPSAPAQDELPVLTRPDVAVLDLRDQAVNPCIRSPRPRIQDLTERLQQDLTPEARFSVKILTLEKDECPLSMPTPDHVGARDDERLVRLEVAHEHGRGLRVIMVASASTASRRDERERRLHDRLHCRRFTSGLRTISANRCVSLSEPTMRPRADGNLREVAGGHQFDRALDRHAALELTRCPDAHGNQIAGQRPLRSK